MVQVHSFACGYPVLSTPFVEKIVLSPLEHSWYPYQQFLTIYARAYFWAFCLWRWMPVSCCFVYGQFSSSVMSADSLRPHGLQHARPPCPSPTPGAYSNSCPSSRWCHPTISSFAVPSFSCLQSFPASGSFPRSQFFTSDGQSIRVSVSASVLPMNIQDWFPLGLTGLISLQSK